MTEELLVQLIAEVEKEDPVDFANLPFDEQMLRDLVCKLVSRQLSGAVGQPRSNTVTPAGSEGAVITARAE